MEGDLDVKTGDDLGVRELPDVDMVAGDNAGDVLDVLFDVVNVEMVGGGLEKDLGGRRSQRDGGAENDEGDEEGDGRISVEAVGGFGEPDYERRHDDTDVAEGVADDVENHGTHTQVVVIVTMTTAAFLPGLVVVVTDMPRVLADSLISVSITAS